MTNELKELVTRLTADFKRRGLFTNIYSDKPNEVSAPHAHGGATLLTLEGSAEVRLDNGTLSSPHFPQHSVSRLC